MRASLHEASSLEGVDETRHVPRRALQQLAERPLRLRTLSPQAPDELGSSSRQTALGEPAVHRVDEQDTELEQALEDQATGVGGRSLIIV